MLFSVFFFFKQKTAYEMRISDWSSDVCSSDPWQFRRGDFGPITEGPVLLPVQIEAVSAQAQPQPAKIIDGQDLGVSSGHIELIFPGARVVVHGAADLPTLRCLVQALRE